MRAVERAAIRVHILGIGLNEDASDHRILDELQRRGYRLQPGELRSVLDELVGRGLVGICEAPAGYPGRRTYETTPAGRMCWAQECRALSKLTHEVFGTRLPPLPPHVGIDDSQAWLSTRDLEDAEDG
ncbi:helix-turn-helix transcriptional regulator [Gordonia metallireducens]|uniref:helix-turn-helix transcriptional regulator n=1 Tax=Gordonia metallireducens TaxID=2897779 RepID=UPI001E631E5B|nr:helix-turn-helix transcriptional regulator [Gordonia metallireducens]